MQYTEAEQRSRLLSPVNDLKATLTDRGVKAGESSRQVDTYNAPHREFLNCEVISEWLRIRAEEGAHR
ncbi:hypothetical protein [Nonomuraea typhae]|uniref:hypothetical protein n=1 Tax=Nonomuraea typhae TaxID=2603600 RepID=UPI0012FB559B|nr:hypothetical protein [Nonomuraea typhae]